MRVHYLLEIILASVDNDAGQRKHCSDLVEEAQTPGKLNSREG
jgi:hypothetical protein